MLQRRKLALITQKQNESDLKFITRVGATARLCEYSDGKEFEEIVSAVAQHSRSRDVRSAALKMLNRKATFTDLVDKVRELEAIRLNKEFVCQRFKEKEPAILAPILTKRPVLKNERKLSNNKQKYDVRPYQRSYGSRNQQGNWRFSRNQNSLNKFGAFRGERCWRCNNFSHAPANCNAVDKECRNCGRVGHLQRACRSYVTPRNSDDQKDLTPTRTSNKIAIVEKDDAKPDIDEPVNELVNKIE